MSDSDGGRESLWRRAHTESIWIQAAGDEGTSPLSMRVVLAGVFTLIGAVAYIAHFHTS